jgi:hypothetical protein
VSVSSPHPGFLDRACRTWGGGGLYTEYWAEEGVDLGFASPGADEVELVCDLIAALRTGAVQAAPSAPTLAAFHVGITRVEGDDIRGTAVTRIRQLLSDLAPALAAGAVPIGVLVVGITAGLFEDIDAERGFGPGWVRLTAARAWCRAY